MVPRCGSGYSRPLKTCREQNQAAMKWFTSHPVNVRYKHPVLVVLFVDHERRGKHAQKMNVGMGAHAVPILGSHVVGHAGSELPSLRWPALRTLPSST